MTEIIMYGAQWCNPCRQVKAKLIQLNKEYTFKDIDNEENAEELKKLGYSSIPVVIKGDVIIRGYVPDALEKL